MMERPSDEGDVGPFVLNLCSVRSAIPIAQPRARGLVKYAFFMSRGMEGDRERFWLHMGYFQSRQEAEKWLGILRRVYPSAFVTSAPVTFAPFVSNNENTTGDPNEDHPSER